MHDVAVNCVRSGDAQKQLARTSLKRSHVHARACVHGEEGWLVSSRLSYCKIYVRTDVNFKTSFTCVNIIRGDV